MQWDTPKLYAVRHKDETIRMNSRSGGIFTALSDNILNSGGTVYGCILTEDLKATHVRAEGFDERDKMRGSKYVQSTMGETFNNAKKDLIDGRNVMFTGTSCQISGLKAFLSKDYPNLYCVDIACYGVPSPLFLEKYISWVEQSYHSECIDFNFRNKKHFGWRECVETLTLRHKNKTFAINSRVYSNVFYSNNSLRPSCYHCPYKSVMHPGDISIADYWGIEKVNKKMDDNKGVSLVFVNNEKGNQLLEKVQKDIICVATQTDAFMRKTYKEPHEHPPTREHFWKEFFSLDFSKIAKKYGGYTYKTKIKEILGIFKSLK